MANVTYDKDITALLVIDPYNDFISKDGKIWDRIRAVAEAMTAFLICRRS
jgi:ureidoacrylate peracid hydrolase